jgi:hypothetical protein
MHRFGAQFMGKPLRFFQACLGGFMQYRCEVLFLCLLFCASAFPQSGGTVLCNPASMTSVPAWIAPGMPHVVEQLPCGKIVKVIGLGPYSDSPGYSSRPRNYAKIQLDDGEAYVDARYIALTETPPKLEVKKTKEAAPEKQGSQESEEQKKWGILTKNQVKFRDEVLLKPVYMNGPRTFSATVSNSSEFPVSNLLLLIRLYDCSDKPKGDYSNCEIIGEAKPVIGASIPPGQTRRVMGSPQFDATPRVRGTFAWGYEILGVRVE